MKQLFTTISDHLKNSVPELKWIDADYGQTDNAELRAALAFPTVLIRIVITPDEQGGGGQYKKAGVTVRAVFNPSGMRTSANAPAAARETALSYINIADKIYLALQGAEIGEYTAPECTYQEQENRTDGLLVVRFTFEISFWDFRAVDE